MVISNMNSILLTAHDLAKQVTAPEGILTILNGVNLTVHSQMAIAILGASGSGKSTLLGLLAGLDTPTRGQVNLLGVDLNSLNEDERALLRLGKVGFVFQSFHLLPGLTALENVILPLELAKNEKSKQIAKEMLDQVGLSHRFHHTPQQLSGGEQQRVALARAFAIKPQILFADEPTGNLDQATGHRIIELLFSLKNQWGTAFILVTHDAELASRCDQCHTLEDGIFKPS